MNKTTKLSKKKTQINQKIKQSINYTTGISSVADTACHLMEIPRAAGLVCDGYDGDFAYGYAFFFPP